MYIYIENIYGVCTKYIVHLDLVYAYYVLDLIAWLIPLGMYKVLSIKKKYLRFFVL